MSNIQAIPGQPGHFIDKTTGERIVLTNTQEADRYDTVEILAGQIAAGKTLRFFRDLTNKERIDTNIPEANKLVTGAERLMIERIGVGIQSSHATSLPSGKDLKRLVGAGYLTLALNRHVISEGPLEMYPSGYGISGMTNESGEAVANIGVPSSAAIRPLREPQLVTNKHTIECEIKFPSRNWLTTSTQPTLDGDNTLRVYCHGLIESSATNN